MRKVCCFIAIILISVSLWAQNYMAQENENLKYGYINDAGEWVISPQFDYAANFNYGFGVVTINGKDGLIDDKGKFIIPCEWDFIDTYDIEKGLLRVEDKKLFGLFDTKGNQLITCEWDDINTYYYDKGLIIIEKGKLFGLMDSKGKQLIKCEWSDINCTNIECDSIVVEKNNLSGVFNLKGEQILPCMFDPQIIKNSWGYYDVRINNKHGLYDGNGKELVPCKYDNPIYFPDERGFVCVTLNGKAGLCDSYGTEVIPCEFSSIYFDDTNAKGYHVIKKNGEITIYGLYTPAGQMLLPCKYTFLAFMSERFYWCKLNGKDVYYDLAGKEISDPYALTEGTQEEDGVKLTGSWTFSVDSSSKVTSLSGDKIENKSATNKTGKLKLRLFLTDKKYSGGSLSGYIAFEAYFDPLQNGNYYYDIDKQYEFTSIPDGTYYATLCLLEEDGGYSIVDYLGFDKLITIDNSAERLQRIVDALDQTANALNKTANALNAFNDPVNPAVPSPSPSLNSPSQGSKLHKQRENCSFCHGTGKNPGKEYPPSYGVERTYDRPPCEICGGRDNHYHKKCPSCNGKGYVEKFKR